MRSRPFLLVVTLALVSGCGSMGGDFEPAIGTNARVEGMDVLSVAAVTDGEGVATVVGTLHNTSTAPNALVGAEVSDPRSDIGVTTRTPLELPPDDPVQMAPSSAVTLTSEDFPVGLLVELTLEFERGPAVDLLIPVEPQEGPYSEIEVTAPPDGDVSPD